MVNDCLIFSSESNIFLLVEQLKNKITVFPSIYFYPISWNGITDIYAHKKINIPVESFMFQYGYTTNNLKTLIDL